MDTPIGPSKFRKLPIEIEAMQLGKDYDTDCEIVKWCGGRAVGEEFADNAVVLIPTLEGEMLGCSGDYIIKGIQGEFYPCKPGIFEATYEPAE